MRLIDADKVKQYVLAEGLYCDTEADKKATAREIDKLFPTVKAIPIEWIRGRLQKAVDFTHNKAEGKFIDNGCIVEVISASFTANVLLKMLEDWEKENEAD